MLCGFTHSLHVFFNINFIPYDGSPGHAYPHTYVGALRMLSCSAFWKIPLRSKKNWRQSVAGPNRFHHNRSIFSVYHMASLHYFWFLHKFTYFSLSSIVSIWGEEDVGLKYLKRALSPVVDCKHVFVGNYAMACVHLGEKWFYGIILCEWGFNHKTQN